MLIKYFNRFSVPAIGVVIGLIAFSLDMLGLGSPGLGRVQSVLIAVGVLVALVGLYYPVPLFSLLGTFLRKASWAGIVLFVISIPVWLLITDLILTNTLAPLHVPTAYGWNVPENTRTTNVIQDTKGNYRAVERTYFTGGFKRWGDLLSGETRVLIVGDSFTEAEHVNNGEEYYAYLEHSFPSYEFFVFGGGGYGTLQEYLVLDKYYDQIRPDTVIWQFCDNDPVNNHYFWDRATYPGNNHATRPYLEDEKIVFRLPLPLGEARQASFIIDRTMLLYDEVQRTQFHESWWKGLIKSDWDIAKKEARVRYAEEANQITFNIMRMVKRRVTNSKVILFNPCAPMTNHEYIMCKELLIMCIPEIYEQFVRHEKRGEQLRVENDGHPNRAGHAVLGRLLSERLRNSGAL